MPGGRLELTVRRGGALDASEREGVKKDLIWFSEFAQAMKVDLAVPNDNEFAENYFDARETFTKGILQVDPERLRTAIGNLLGIAQAADEVPSFLGEEHGMPTVWLKPEDLGDVAHFYDGWVQLCQWRENEGRDIAPGPHRTMRS